MAAGVVAVRQIGVEPAFVLTGAEELLQGEAPQGLAGRALLPLGSGLGSQVGLRVARATEWSLAALGLILLVPLAPLLLAASVLSSGRSPLLRARRIGLDLTSFEMLRLRSGPGPLGDQGGGWLGGLLRWSHADELPQLINVLRGDMALVGPRPVAPQTADGLDEWQRARFSVRPGITGIWQLDRLRRWRLEQMIASDLLLDYWALWLVLAVVLVAGVLLGRRTEFGRRIIDWTRINTPLVGPSFRKVIISRSIRTLGTMISNGVAVLDAIQLTAEVSGNYYYEKAWLYVRAEVTNGGRIADALRDNPLFPNTLIQMIRSGEETGKLDYVLGKVSTYYDGEVETSLKTVTSMIEPLMISVMGVVVGTIGLSLLLPIFTLSRAN